MMIIPFTSPEATLENAGGKAANLARLTRAGFDVPRGFILSTTAYREFVKANKLEAVIRHSVEQGIIPRAFTVEELFAPTTHSLTA